ncbi:hypothetical protein RJ639_033464 [Escallonia herrerae]|uniref:Uncharacterized protein n=1 Tax=Escallonia herrerae TaxID=1293975 RepID=A0AA89BGK2_9ASTE|nr:hypothetical protein RJ639_033464 [Escallonia herrerae]
MDIWPWICELPNSDEWEESKSLLTFQLASSSPSESPIQLKAERTFGSNSDAPVITFSVCCEQKTLWVSDTCPLASDNPFLPLVLQLLQEIITRSPTAQDSTCPRSQLQKLKPEPVSWILDSHSPESFSSFFNLIFLTRLFWLCVCDAPSEIGSFYFHSLLVPNLEAFSCKDTHVLRAFFISVGTDVELCLMRTFGYMLAKWLILREVGVGLKSLTPLPSHNLGFSYAKESHGLWILKSYAPVIATTRTRYYGQKSQLPVIETKESVLKYALAHQQLEAVIQLEYTVGFNEGFLQVSARVDNLRLHVAKLGFSKDEGNEYTEERHFPSRIRVWVGPEVGASYVSGLSLGRSTDNVEKEMETQKVMKSSFGKTKVPRLKAMTTTTTRTRMRNWRWDQDVEGNAAIFDGVLCDNTTGIEVATWKSSSNSDGDDQSMNNFRKRYTGTNRPFTKSGGLIFGGGECGERVAWRLNKEMEGSVLKWRMGGRVWLSYWPNDVKSSYFETRCVQWCDEVDLPLIPGNY